MCNNVQLNSDEATRKRSNPSTTARYVALSILVGVFATWHKLTFYDEKIGVPSVDFQLHSYKVPLSLTLSYLVTLPLLNKFVSKFLAPKYDMKALLFESMVFYNVAQVCMNVWMVWRFINAVLSRGHPFIGSIDAIGAGTTFTIWVHYTNKYLEFLDTYFMVLRGKMDQVTFLHLYHHTTIAWAWWIALKVFPGGDSYFGALLNSLIHVMMYSYYALALLKIPCPWKRYLTQAQLVQFACVIIYTVVAMAKWERREFGQVLCLSVQIFEMSSLLFLFTLFYKKSYGKNSKSNKESHNKDEDACSKAMGKASEKLMTAAKETNKFVKSANGIVNGTSAIKPCL